MNDYISRTIEIFLERKLNFSGCVLATGPKFCGKTTLCEHYAKSKISLKTESKKILEADLIIALEGETPHLIVLKRKH